MEQVLVMAMHMTNIIKVDWLKVVVEDFHNFFRRNTQNRRKDLESLGRPYLLYYFLCLIFEK